MDFFHFLCEVLCGEPVAKQSRRDMIGTISTGSLHFIFLIWDDPVD